MAADAFHPAPVWFTKSYFLHVLRTYKNDSSLEIKDFQLKPATAKGENYASVMTRINVLYTSSTSSEEHEDSFIIKTSHENDEFPSLIMKSYRAFETEIMMYEKILPKLSQLLEKIEHGCRLFADTVYVDYEHTAIIFNDLSVENFVLPDRFTGFDVEHAKLILDKLAKMHAAGAVLNEMHPNILTKFDRGIFNRHTRGFGDCFENMFEECANFADKCPELGSQYKKKLLKLKENVVEYARRVMDPQSDMFLTLNHGDLWTNNIMIRYSTMTEKSAAHIQAIRFIDFQYSNWANPAEDIHFLINTSLDANARFNHQDNLLKEYQKTLSSSLKKLNYRGPIPSLRQILWQMEMGRFYALTSAIAVQPMLINENTDDGDLKSVFLDDEVSRNFRQSLYANEKVRNYLKKLLPYFDRIGLLEAEQ